MPSMTGGDSSTRDYAPYMWILPHGGDPEFEDDYVYVGNTGSVHVEVDGTDFHIGATALGELVCEASEVTGNYWDPHIFVGGIHHKIIPEQVLRSALNNALDANAAMPDRQQLVVSLLHAIPDFAGIEVNFPDTMSVAEIFGTGVSREDIRASLDDMDRQISYLRVRLGLD